MKPNLLLVTGNNERFAAEAIEAAQSVFPDAAIRRAGTPAAAMESDEAPGTELLVLLDASRDGITEASVALDTAGLPRWPVVARGEYAPIPHAEIVSPAEWNAALLARVFRTSVALHALRRERDRLRGDLMSVGIRITHDLRTPVGGILSATEVLDVSVPGLPKGKESLTQPIVESANDLVKVVGQLNLLAKASTMADAREKFNMGAVADRAVERVQLKVREKGATVSLPGSWPDATGNQALVESVWLGLLDNALRHGGASPTIRLGWEAQSECNRFWVDDNGPGVPAARRRLLFHPFHRLHEPNSTRGLGLSIVERLVHLQGGGCGYEAADPLGSRFFFTLPK
jgi:K+-sensing histidine kinase KdpD